MTPRRFFWTALAGAAVLTAAVFGRSLGYDFVYDDLWTIVRNPAMRTASVGEFFTDASTVAAPETGMGRTIYRPLPTLSFAATARLAGPRPWAFRLPNLMLHALNGALVASVLLLLLKTSPEAALLGGALFLLHPAQVESVVWITQRSNLMCAAGGLAALLLTARGNPLGLLCFAAALLSKETAFTLLPVLILVMPADGKRARRAAAMTTVTVGAFALRIFVTGGVGQRAWRGSFVENMLIGQASWLEYLRLLFVPTRLSASHLQYVASPWEHPAPWIGAALMIAWIVGIVALWKRDRRWAATLIWVPLTLSPHLGFFPTDTFAAERFLYLPLAGVAAMGAMAFDRRRLWGTATAVLLIAGVSAFQATAAWRNEMTLWRSATAAEPNNPFCRLALADAYHARSDFAQAAQHTREGLTLSPSAHLACVAFGNLSDYALREGRPGAAARFAERALRIDPSSENARRNLEKAVTLSRR